VRDHGFFLAVVLAGGLLSAASCGDSSGPNSGGVGTGGVGGASTGGTGTGGTAGGTGGTGGTSAGTGGVVAEDGSAGDASVGGTGAAEGGTCNPETCPLPNPTPPTVKCCFTPSGPCGYDFGQGAGCQVPFVGDM